MSDLPSHSELMRILKSGNYEKALLPAIRKLNEVCAVIIAEQNLIEQDARVEILAFVTLLMRMAISPKISPESLKEIGDKIADLRRYVTGVN